MPQALDTAAVKNPVEITPSLFSTRIIAVALLAILAFSLFASVRQESQIYDEGIHIFAGFEYWKHGDFGRNPEHPPLAKLLATLPLLSMHLKEPGPVRIPFFKAQDTLGGAQLLYAGGAGADAILMRCRMMIALFSLALGVLVFFAAQEMFNRLTGLLALGLFVFEPTVLAHGALVTTDMALSCLFFAAVFSFYLYVRKPSPGAFAACAVTTACAIVTKHSGILILPALFLLAVAELWLGSRENADAENSGTPGSKVGLRQLAVLAGAVLVVSYAAVWAIYGFRYAARPDQLQIIPTLAQYAAALNHPMERSILMFCAAHHLLPEAYLYGWVDILLIPSYRPTFLLGHVLSSGRWYFFPAVFLIKTTLTLLVLLVLAPFARIHGKRREFICLVLPAAVFMAASIVSMLNMGVRHILPIFPFCIVLAAAAAAAFLARSLPARVAVCALLLLTVVSSLHAFPDYLAYSNEAVGGPSHTYRLATDSNADWGQTLKWTKAYLDKNPTQDCWLSYVQFTVQPAYYGVSCHPLLTGLAAAIGVPSPPIPSTVTGTFFISGTDASGLMWGPEELNPYRVFFDRKPDAMIGNAVLVFHGTFDLSLLAAETNATNAASLLQQQRVTEALPLAQAAVQQAPNSAITNLVLGQALMASGNVAEGKQALATAVHLAQTIHPDYQAWVVEAVEHPRGP